MMMKGMLIMPDWNDLLDEIKESGSIYDLIRRKYLKSLHQLTGRNVIIYYSGWLQRPGLKPSELASINDNDKNGFMTTIHKLDRTIGLDLVLHTPGGEMAATESLIKYLRDMFGTNIRAIVPQLAMSGGTMIACACKSIVMGKQSSLGPIDPIYYGLPAHGVIEEFEQAKEEVKRDPSTIHLWQQIIARYNPTLIGECKKAIAWSNDMVTEWLTTGMFEGDSDVQSKVDKIVNELSDHSLTKSHGRHISSSRCKEIGLKIEDMEENDDLQDAILTLHHACIHTLTATPAIKIIENHNGKAFVLHQIVQAVTKTPFNMDIL